MKAQQVEQASRSCLGVYGGPPGGNEGPSKNSIAPKLATSISPELQKKHNN